jgi:hypothetical protein
MASEDRPLELDPLVRRDHLVGECAETGVDPVDRASRGVQPLDQRSGGRHPPPRGIANLDRSKAAGDLDQVAEAERGTVEREHAGASVAVP